MLKLLMFTSFCDVQNLGAWSFVGANGQPGSIAIGNTLMLLMKPPTAQVGVPLVFHIRAITKVGFGLYFIWANVLQAFMSPPVKPF